MDAESIRYWLTCCPENKTVPIGRVHLTEMLEIIAERDTLRGALSKAIKELVGACEDDYCPCYEFPLSSDCELHPEPGSCEGVPREKCWMKRLEGSDQ